MSADYIRFKNVRFSYDEKSPPILDDCSFTVKQGQRVVLKGQSGTGKTTIFRLLLGFKQPEAGKIFYKGDLLDNETIREIRKQTAWLPQDLNLGSDTVRSLVDFPFQFEENSSHKPDSDKIIEVFSVLGLSDSLLDKNFADLSTGQRQRVGIAICYLLDKPLILLDEPTSALDLKSQERVANLLMKDQELTILSTSHDPRWIKQCDKVYELNA